MGRQNQRYDEDKALLRTIRQLNEATDSENSHHSEDAIAITNDSFFGDNALQSEIDNFRQTVEPGAKFGKGDNPDAQSNPLVYFPETGNLVFSGTIPTLSNLKFQFSLNDVTKSPYIFVDGLALSESTIEVINKIRGYYLNWRDSWLARTDDLEKIGKSRN